MLEEAAQQLEVNVVARNAGLGALSGHGLWREAMALLGEADVVSFNALASACVRAQCWREALAVLSAARGARLRLSRVSSGVAVSAWTQNGWRSALHGLQLLCQAALEANVVAVSSALPSLPWPRALRVLPHQMDTTARVALATACGDEAWPRALHLGAEMQRPSAWLLALGNQALRSWALARLGGLDLFISGKVHAGGDVPGTDGGPWASLGSVWLGLCWSSDGKPPLYKRGFGT